MSQLDGIGAPPYRTAGNPAAPHAAPQPNAGRAAGAAAAPRINDIVRHAEVLPPPAPRAAQEAAPPRFLAARIGIIALRVLGAIATLGVTEIVGALIRRAEQREAPAPRVGQPGVPPTAPTAAQINRSIGNALTSGGLSEPYQAAVGEAVAQLREAFGNDLVPEGVTDLSDLPSSYEIRRAVRAGLNSMQDAVSPEALRDIIKEKAAPSIACKAAELALAQAFQKVGHEADASLEADSLFQANSGLAVELGVCLDRTAVDNVLGAWKNDIEAYATHVKCLSESKSAALGHAVATLAGAYVVSAEDMRHHLNLGKLEDQLKNVEPEVGTPEAGIRQICMDKADAFIRQKLELLRSVDELPVSQELKAFWKEELLEDETLDTVDVFRRAEAVVAHVTALDGPHKIQGVEELFRSDKPDVHTVYIALQSLCLTFHDAFLAVHGGVQGWNGLDGNDKGTVRFHSAKVLLDRMPALRAALENEAALLAELHGQVGKDMESPDIVTKTAAQQMDFLLLALETKSVDNAALASTIGDLDKMPMPFLAALNQADAAVRASFPALDLPLDLPEGMLSLTPAISPQVKDALRDAVSKADTPLTPASFAELARQVMNTAAANIVLMERVHGAAAEGQPLQRYQDNDIARTLLLRHPALKEVFAAGDAAAVAAALDELGGELGEIVRVYKDINAAWVAGENHIYSRMSEATGLSEDELRQELSLVGVTRGGSFHYTMADHIAAIKEPKTSLLAFPSTADIMREYEGIAERFVYRKGAVYQSIDDLEGLPEAARAELRHNVLTDSVLRMPDFLTRCSAVAARMDAAPLLEALRRPTTAEDMVALMRQLAAAYDRQSRELFPPETLEKMGSDETGAIMRYSLQIFFAQHPALKGVFHPQFAATLDTALETDLVRLSNALGNLKNTREVQAALMAEYAQLMSTMAILTDMRRAE